MTTETLFLAGLIIGIPLGQIAACVLIAAWDAVSAWLTRRAIRRIYRRRL